MPYNFGKNGTKGKGKLHKGLGFQPERGEQRHFGGYCNWCWRLCHKEAQCWFKQEYKEESTAGPVAKDLREWSNSAEKGQGHNQPKGKGEGKNGGKGKRKHGKENRNQAGSLVQETGQRTLGDFGTKRQRVEVVGDVQENDDFETPEWIEQLMCFAFKSSRVS